MVIPHSFFLKYLPEGSFDDGINYREKYMIWHCKQFTDHNRNIKWCPAKNCNNIIEKSDYAMRDMVECACGQSFCFKCGLEYHSPANCE